MRCVVGYCFLYAHHDVTSAPTLYAKGYLLPFSVTCVVAFSPTFVLKNKCRPYMWYGICEYTASSTSDCLLFELLGRSHCHGWLASTPLCAGVLGLICRPGSLSDRSILYVYLLSQTSSEIVCLKVGHDYICVFLFYRLKANKLALNKETIYS
jgi:hypothetical protein